MVVTRSQVQLRRWPPHAGTRPEADQIATPGQVAWQLARELFEVPSPFSFCVDDYVRFAVLTILLANPPLSTPAARQTGSRKRCAGGSQLLAAEIYFTAVVAGLGSTAISTLDGNRFDR